MNTLFQVPPIDVHRRIYYDLITENVLMLVENFSLQKAILFGSYAYGSLRSESDIDLL